MCAVVRPILTPTVAMASFPGLGKVEQKRQDSTPSASPDAKIDRIFPQVAISYVCWCLAYLTAEGT